MLDVPYTPKAQKLCMSQTKFFATIKRGVKGQQGVKRQSCQKKFNLDFCRNVKVHS